MNLFSTLSNILIRRDVIEVVTAGLGEVCQISKDVFLIQPGEVADELVYIDKGIFKGYHINNKGEEVILCFFSEGQFLLDIAGFEHGGPCSAFVQAVEDSCIYRLSASRYAELLGQYPEVEQFKSFVLEENYRIIEQHMQELRLMTPAARYAHMQNVKPEWIDRIPQHLLAKYLGIAPQSLSRIRARRS